MNIIMKSHLFFHLVSAYCIFWMRNLANLERRENKSDILITWSCSEKNGGQSFQTEFVTILIYFLRKLECTQRGAVWCKAEMQDYSFRTKLPNNNWIETIKMRTTKQGYRRDLLGKKVWCVRTEAARSVFGAHYHFISGQWSGGTEAQ